MNRIKILLALITLVVSYSPAFGQTLPSSLQAVLKLAPSSVADLSHDHSARIAEASQQLLIWGAQQSAAAIEQQPSVVLSKAESICIASGQIENAYQQCFELRTQISAVTPEATQRTYALNYLKNTSALKELVGRMRYLTRDAIESATYDLDSNSENYQQLIDMLIKHRVSTGPAAVSYALFDPPAASGAIPFSATVKIKILHLIAVTRQVDLVADVVDFLRENKHPTLAVYALSTLQYIGLPQPWLEGQGSEIPKPEVETAELLKILNDIDPSRVDKRYASAIPQLKQWLSARHAKGETGESYRWGSCQLQPGDWLLMRNPSPYNRFTDLAPGLFTHVGVVSTKTGKDGKRRFVIVDLPERGRFLPATNVDAYLRRTLHYVFLRHNDPVVTNKMGQVASSLVGRPTQFDLLFQTNRVKQYQGKLVEAERIHTYCAGFLLLCAQETSANVDDFFPIRERPAGSNCLVNLGKLGLSIGEDFVSPSGALFSPNLGLAGSCEPMYSPNVEIKETVYDYFANSVTDRKLTPAPDTYQALREKVARMAGNNPLLAKALASANNVSEHMDLASAAKAYAVIESLDEIADENAELYSRARQAITAGPTASLQNSVSSEQLQQILSSRRVHSALHQRWESEQISPRQLRIELVEYYRQRGKRQLDQKFFERR